ncbi:sensor histidine kinase [Streptomyces sp. NPDC002004]
MIGRIRGWHRHGWLERSKVERVELQSMVMLLSGIWVFYVSWLLMPLSSGLHHTPLGLALGGLLLTVTAGETAYCHVLIRRAVDHYLGRTEQPVRELAVSGALTVVSLLVVVGLAAVEVVDGWALALMILAVVLPFGMAYALLVPVRLFLARAALSTVPLVGAFALAGTRNGELASVVLTVAVAAGMSLLMSRCGAWTLAVMWEAERARDVQARLAVAEERLRFGRDLHDVLGRNLAVIALKGELAVQLARRGRPEAVEQMIEVQRIAQESQREVREVVRGYRAADLAAELAGAQGVLTAAGIDCTVTGSPAGLPAPVQSVLGWVVRETTTNVLRHGDAARCTVTLRTTEDHAVLVVENDGAGGSEATDVTSGGSTGSGLRGLRERLSVVRGTLEAGPVGEECFRVTAEVPLPAPPGSTAAGRRDGADEAVR